MEMYSEFWNTTALNNRNNSGIEHNYLSSYRFCKPLNDKSRQHVHHLRNFSLRSAFCQSMTSQQSVNSNLFRKLPIIALVNRRGGLIIHNLRGTAYRIVVKYLGITKIPVCINMLYYFWVWLFPFSFCKSRFAECLMSRVYTIQLHRA